MVVQDVFEPDPPPVCATSDASLLLLTGADTPYSTQRKIDVRVLGTVAAGPVVTVGKPERFSRRLFQAAVEIIKKKLPKASFVDFHSCGSFHRLFFFFFGSFFFLNEFPLWKTGPNRVTNPTPDCFNGFRRLSNARRTGRELRRMLR